MPRFIVEGSVRATCQEEVWDYRHHRNGRDVRRGRIKSKVDERCVAKERYEPVAMQLIAFLEILAQGLLGLSNKR